MDNRPFERFSHVSLICAMLRRGYFVTYTRTLFTKLRPRKNFRPFTEKRFTTTLESLFCPSPIANVRYTGTWPNPAKGLFLKYNKPDFTSFLADVPHDCPRLCEVFSFRSHNKWHLTQWRPTSWEQIELQVNCYMVEWWTKCKPPLCWRHRMKIISIHSIHGTFIGFITKKNNATRLYEKKKTKKTPKQKETG